MKPSKKLLIFFLTSVLLFLSYLITKACGPFSSTVEEYRISIFNSKIGDKDSAFEPYYFNLSESHFDDKYDIANNQENKDNYKEWKNELKQKYSYNDFVDVMKCSKCKNIFEDSFSPTFQNNSFIDALRKNEELKQYFKIAKETEDFNSVGSFNDKWGLDDSVKIEPTLLLNKIYKTLLTTNSKFIKTRCVYLLCRLYYYQNNSKDLKQVYEKYLYLNNNKSWVNIGSKYFYTLMCVNDSIQFTKNLLDVIEVSASKRYRAIDILNNKDIKFNINNFSNSITKANYIIATNIYNNEYCLNKIKYLHIYDANNPFLKIFLTREINKIEHWLLTPISTNYNTIKGYEFYETLDLTKQKVAKLQQQNRLKDLQYAEEVKSFIKQLMNKNNADKIVLNTYLCHLNFLTADFTASLENSNYIIKNSNKNSIEYLQALTNKTLANIELNKGLNEKLQNEVLHIIATTTNKKVIDYWDTLNYNQNFINFLSSRLLKLNDFVHASLLKNISTKPWGEIDNCWNEDAYIFLYKNANSNNYDDLISFVKTSNKTPLEKFCIKNKTTNYNYNRNIFENTNVLYDLQGTFYLNQDNLEKAYDCFKRIDKSYWVSSNTASSDFLLGNPFKLNVYDPFATNNFDDNDTTYLDKSTFIKEFINKKTQFANAKENNKKAKMAFEIGNAYYNLTHNGKFWIMSKPWWSGGEDENEKINLIEKFNSNYYQFARAKYYYKTAFQLTSNKKDASLYALYTNFCEDGFATIDNDKSAKNQFDILEKLEKKAGSIDFYNQLIDDCDVYANYISKM